MKVLIKQILREETRGELNNRARHLLDMMAVASLKNIADGDIESMRKALRDVEESGIDWDEDVVKSVREKYKNLMLRAKEVLKEEQKKKLFIPRRQSGENSKWNQWNKEQPVKDGIRINQYTHDGLKTGIWESYYENGNIWYKGSYKDGKEDGIWEEYWDDGNIYLKGLYKEGKRDGIWEIYHENGNIESKESYKEGKREGIWEEYWLNGNIRTKGLYKDGKRDGIWEEYHTNGNIKSRGSYKDGKREGIWEYYYENGNIWYKGLYIDGEREGIWEEYYDNGNLISKGLYVNGKREGIWEFYHDNGNIESKGLFKDGIYIKSSPLTESEQPKKKLFIPRKIDERNAEYDRIIKNIIDKLLVENNIKSIKFKIKDPLFQGYLEYRDIENSVINGNGEIILNNGEKLNMVRGWYGISHSDFIDYANAFSGYLTHLIDIIKNNESIITRLVVNVDTTKDKTKIDITFNDNHVLDYFKINHRDGYNPKFVEFSKIL